MREKGNKLNNKLVSDFINKSISHINNQSHLYNITEITMSKIFYKNNYEKSVGLPSKHIINKVIIYFS